MSETLSAMLIDYGSDGDYTSLPVALEASVVFDEVHDWVIEIVLPTENTGQERAVLLPLAEFDRWLAGHSRVTNQLVR